MGLSKKVTRAGSLRREARTCSKEKDHSIPDSSEPLSWLLLELEVLELEVLELSGVVEPSLDGDSSSCAAVAALAGLEDSRGLLGSCSFRPTSSILRRRLVT